MLKRYFVTEVVPALILCLYLGGCSTGRVVVERLESAAIQLPKEARTIEVQSIGGSRSDEFKMALTQILTDRTSLNVIHSQTRNDLIDGKLRGSLNKQNYKQADLLIKGTVQEEVERRIGPNGVEQYAVTSRPFLQLIHTSSGEVLLSKYFIGTSISQVLLQNSNTFYDGYTDALTSARRVALEKFVGLFTPQLTWMEIDLYKFSDSTKFDEIRNLIGYGHYQEAKTESKDYLDKVNNDTEKGKVLFCFAVIESLTGNYPKAKELLHQSHQAYPNENTLKYFKTIDKLESEKQMVTVNR